MNFQANGYLIGQKVLLDRHCRSVVEFGFAQFMEGSVRRVFPKSIADTLFGVEGGTFCNRAGFGFLAIKLVKSENKSSHFFLNYINLQEALINDFATAQFL